MTLKINNLEIENIKRVKAVRLEPSHNGTFASARPLDARPKLMREPRRRQR